MTAILLTLVRVIGLPALTIIGLLAFYEGVPVINKIPYIQYVPLAGHLAVGRVEFERQDAAADARKGYVLEIEKVALQAQLDRERRERISADAVAEEYRRRAEAAKTSEAVAAEEAEREIEAYEAELRETKRSCLIDDDFIERLRRNN